MFHQLLEQALRNLYESKDELALVSIIPLFDKACSKKWPKDTVRNRFYNGVNETDDIITFFMSKGHAVMIACRFGEFTLPQIIYKYLRSNIIHEGKMPDNIHFVDEPKIDIEKDDITLPKQLVLGLLMAAIGFECYRKERNKINGAPEIKINQHRILIADAIGNHDFVRNIINEEFPNKNAK